MAGMLAALSCSDRSPADGLPGSLSRVADELTLSASAGEHSIETSTALQEWWSERNRVGQFEVRRIPFSELRNWHFDALSGNLVHESGRFFSIEGMRIQSRDGKRGSSRPVINQ